MGDDRRGELLALTGLRGYAALWVLLFHLRHHLQPLVPQTLYEVCVRGYLGVDLFFVLSGFVIAYRYGGRIPGRRSYAAYVLRRLGRIYPLHLVTFLILAAVAQWGSSVGVDLGESSYYEVDARVLYNLLLVQAWGVTNEPSWNLPSWSISVEWLAYLAFPLLWLGVARARSVASSLAGVIVIVVGLPLVLIALDQDGLHTTLELRLVRGVPEFVAGMLLFRIDALRGEERQENAWPYLLVAALCFVAAYVLWSDWPFLPGACLVVYALARAPSTGAFASRIPAWLGLVSYSIYLLHLPMLKAASRLMESLGPGWGFVLAYLVAVLVASALSYRLIERPCRTWARKRADALGA